MISGGSVSKRSGSASQNMTDLKLWFKCHNLNNNKRLQRYDKFILYVHTPAVILSILPFILDLAKIIE